LQQQPQQDRQNRRTYNRRKSDRTWRAGAAVLGIAASFALLMFGEQSCNKGGPSVPTIVTAPQTQEPVVAPPVSVVPATVLPQPGVEAPESDKVRWAVTFGKEVVIVEFIGDGGGYGCLVWNGPGSENFLHPAAEPECWEFKNGEKHSFSRPKCLDGGLYQVDWRTQAGDVAWKFLQIEGEKCECQVGEWTEWVYSEWSACDGGLRTRTAYRTRNVIDEGNSEECPPLREEKTEEEKCEVPPCALGGNGVTAQTGGGNNYNPTCHDFGLVTRWKDEDPDDSNGPVNGITWDGRTASSSRFSFSYNCATNGNYSYSDGSNSPEVVWSWTSTDPIRGLIVKASNTALFQDYPNALSGLGPLGIVKDDNNFSTCDYYDLSHVEFCVCPDLED